MEQQNNLFQIKYLRNLDSLETELITISYLLGIKDAPDNQIIKHMADIIKAEFGQLTTDQVSDAVKKALSGKLNVNFQTYNNFTIPYICKILVAYVQWDKEEKKLRPKQPDQAPEKTPDEKKETTTRWLNNVIFPQLEMFFNTGEYNIEDYGNTLYNYLKKQFINFSSEKQQEIKEEARKELIEECKANLYKEEKANIKKEIADILSHGSYTDGLVRTRSRRIALKDYLFSCRNKGYDLISEIKKYEQAIVPL